MDDFGRIFRRLFNFPSNSRDEFHANRWDDDPNDNLHPRPRNRREESDHDDFDSMFDLFHGNIFQEMDSLHRQMEDMMRNVGAMDFPSEMEPPPIGELPPQGPHSDDSNIKVWFGTPSPFFHSGGNRPEQRSPREFMLKEDEEPGRVPALPPKISPPSQPGPESGRNPPILYRPGWGPREKKDTDLDGQLSEKEVVDLITKQPQQPQHPPAVSDRRMPFSWGKSVSVTRVQRPDGKIEEHRVVKDSAGRVESSVTKSADGQSHTLTTITGQDGSSETTETLHNIDEKDKGTFQAQWQFPPGPARPADSLMPPDIEQRDKDLFFKLFGWK